MMDGRWRELKRKVGALDSPEREFIDRIFGGNVPYSGSLELTHRCNLSCRHCYQFAARDGEMEAGSWIALLEELASLGCLFVSFTGGEPLLRPDLPRLLEAAAGMDYAITVQTNGTLIDKRTARLLGGYPTLRVDVSVYGSRPATHDALTGVGGSFAAARRGMELLLEEGVPLLLKVTVGAFNLDEVEGIASLADSLGIKAIFSSLIFPRNDRDPAPVSLRLDDAGLERFIRFETAYMLENLAEMLGVEGKTLTYEDLAGYVRKCAVDPARLESENRRYCGAGRTVFAVNPYGDVYPCVALPLVLGNLIKDNFARIWKDSPPIIRLREREDELAAECEECDLLEKCAICRALSYLEAGDTAGLSRERCRQTRTLLKVLEHEEARS
ncbi:MAG: radical SAM protein [Actinobacteria bacterium]|nr:radical SAM protein [Actinomycetota bacterium]